MKKISLIKKKIVEGDLKEAFDDLAKYLSKSSKFFNHFLILQTSFNELKNEYLLGTVSRDVYNAEKTKQIKNLFDLLDILKESDFQENENPIKPILSLVLCHNEEDKEYMMELIRYLKIENTSVKLDSEQIISSDFHLIIFDNRFMSRKSKTDMKIQQQQIQQRQQLMQTHLDTVLEKGQPLLMHFGGHRIDFKGEKYENWRDFLFTVNSRFAFKARVEEILEYIRLTELKKVV